MPKKREFKVERENFSLVLHLLSEFSASKEKVRLQSIKAFKKVPWAQLFLCPYDRDCTCVRLFRFYLDFSTFNDW